MFSAWQGNFVDPVSNSGTAAGVATWYQMATEAGKCALIIHGQRFQGITFAFEWNGGAQAFGFLSGPIEILRKARTARSFNVQLDDGAMLAAIMLQVNESGLALVAIDPEAIRAKRDS